MITSFVILQHIHTTKALHYCFLILPHARANKGVRQQALGPP
uniref:Uncharacterized protein n=1 Tax=Arundo donax TaxID=35708 RepID=A0A0A9CCJ6_ARUDO